MEPVVIGSIATAAVKLLSPFFAEVMKGAASETGKATAGTAVAKVRELYNAVRTKFVGVSPAEEALNDLEKAPDDEDTQAALRAQLKKILASDEVFAAQLSGLIKGAEVAGAGSVFNTNITGEVKNLTNIGSVHGGLTIQ